jgi:hypothetical protein
LSQPLPRKTTARRSMMTSDPFRLDGVDMRSPRGRRFRDIVDTLIADGFDAAGVDALREMAGFKFSLEEAQAAVISGNAAARNDVVRLANLIVRCQKEIREVARQKPAARAPNLHEYLAAEHQ